MLIYYLLFITFFVLGIVLFKSNVVSEKKARIIYGIAFFFLIGLLLALRHPSMGVDLGYGKSTGYLASFEKIAKLSWGDVFTRDWLNYERGYIVFNKLVSTIFNSRDPQTLLMVCGFISALSPAILIAKESKNQLLSTLIYIALPSFYIAFSGLRQAVALSITMLAYLMIKNKRWVKFILLVILASLFHSSAIVFLIAYPLYYIKHNSIYKLASVVSVFVVYILRVPLFRILGTFFKDNVEIEETGAFMLFLVLVAIYLFLMIFSDNENKVSTGTTNIFLVACYCQAFGGIHNLAMRVGYYFMVYAMIAIPEVVENHNEENIKVDFKTKQLIKWTLMAAFVLFAIYQLTNGNKDSWYMTNPYNFYWEQLN